MVFRPNFYSSVSCLRNCLLSLLIPINSLKPNTISYSSFFFIIYFNQRIINLQYGDDFCHTSTWIGHRYTCVPRPDPEPHSHLPPHPISWGCPRARLGWFKRVALKHLHYRMLNRWPVRVWCMKWCTHLCFLMWNKHPGKDICWMLLVKPVLIFPVVLFLQHSRLC